MARMRIQNEALKVKREVRLFFVSSCSHLLCLLSLKLALMPPTHTRPRSISAGSRSRRVRIRVDRECRTCPGRRASPRRESQGGRRPARRGGQAEQDRIGPSRRRRAPPCPPAFDSPLVLSLILIPCCPFPPSIAASTNQRRAGTDRPSEAEQSPASGLGPRETRTAQSRRPDGAQLPFSGEATSLGPTRRGFRWTRRSSPGGWDGDGGPHPFRSFFGVGSGPGRRRTRARGLCDEVSHHLDSLSRVACCRCRCRHDDARQPAASTLLTRRSKARRHRRSEPRQWHTISPRTCTRTRGRKSLGPRREPGWPFARSGGGGRSRTRSDGMGCAGGGGCGGRRGVKRGGTFDEYARRDACVTKRDTRFSPASVISPHCVTSHDFRDHVCGVRQ